LKKAAIHILLTILLALNVCAEELPDSCVSTNVVWDVFVNVSLPPEALSEAFKERFFSEQRFTFYLSKGRIRASTGSYNPHLSVQMGLSPMNAFITLVDQQAILSNVCCLAKGDASPDADGLGGISIDVDVTVDGEKKSFKYKPFEEKFSSSNEVHQLLSLLRRNLPPSFDKLFNYLRIAKLPPLTDGKADQFRRCLIHDEWMKVGTVPVSFGYYIESEAYLDSQKKSFPNACTTIGGGCVDTPDKLRTSTTLYCESCRKAEAKWQRENTPK
jgi:hypothetical protein